MTLDREGFDRAMAGQRDKARAKSKFGAPAAGDAAWQVRQGLPHVPDTFRGYDVTSLDTRIVELLDSNRQAVERLNAGDDGFVALAETPFYLQSGGQVSDRGRLITSLAEARVDDVVKGPAGLPRFHVVHVEKGALSFGDQVRAEVDTSLRDATRRNHTATHLLHAALRRVLGEHVLQAGSLVAPDRLRFDYSHYAAPDPAQLKAVEDDVNRAVLANFPVAIELRTLEDARNSGAIALFGEKYEDEVRVIRIVDAERGDLVSAELCGGTHVARTGDIGLFRIVSDESIASGTRRMEADAG